MSVKIDEDDAEDLDLYANNTGEIYPKKLEIIARMKNHIVYGSKAAALSPVPWKTWFLLAVNRYCREFGQHERKRFPLNLIQHLAEQQAKYEYDLILSGEYN